MLYELGKKEKQPKEVIAFYTHRYNISVHPRRTLVENLPSVLTRIIFSWHLSQHEGVAKMILSGIDGFE
jgi:hypothetical protein